MMFAPEPVTRQEKMTVEIAQAILAELRGLREDVRALRNVPEVDIKSANAVSAVVTNTVPPTRSKRG